MNCKRVQRRLNAFRAGQLRDRLSRRLAAHLDACPACRAESEQLQRLDAGLRQWTIAAEPRPGFEQRVWNRIRAAEQLRPAFGWWQRPAWVLGAACAIAVLSVTATGLLAHQQADRKAKQHLYAAIGLNQLDNYPAGSLTAAYFHQP
ncbi:MAG: zf-HC2 domain-containing protein [Verrucomicrobia bacterium]|nr:zf-HC2 domain-containing protein [Verrucomicrobiota bacterium]